MPKSATTKSFSFQLKTDQYRALPIPNSQGRLGECFVPVTDLPEELSDFMEVNPRVPSRTTKGVLAGSVIKGIKETLEDYPQDMAIKNQGIYLLVANAEHKKESGGMGVLTISLEDPSQHGIVNGGHTFAAIRDTIEKADESQLESLETAYVRIHILLGIEKEKVPEIADGLNRSKQVDDPSLDNLRGHFEKIKNAMKNKPGADQIAYNQGADGDVYVTEVIAFLELFNTDRFDNKRHPHNLFSRKKTALQFFTADLDKAGSPITLITENTFEILSLADNIRRAVPSAANKVGFQFGRMKERQNAKSVAKQPSPIPLHFLGGTSDYRVPRGWLYPLLAAFRANIVLVESKRAFGWGMPVDELIEAVLPELVEVCVKEHRDNGMKPDQVGKRESVYSQCYDKVLLHLLRSRVASEKQ